MDSETLLREIEDTARQMGITPATLCQRAVKNSKLPARLRKGSVTLKTYNLLRNWMTENAQIRRAS